MENRDKGHVVEVGSEAVLTAALIGVAALSAGSPVTTHAIISELPYSQNKAYKQGEYISHEMENGLTQMDAGISAMTEIWRSHFHQSEVVATYSGGKWSFDTNEFWAEPMELKDAGIDNQTLSIWQSTIRQLNATSQIVNTQLPLAFDLTKGAKVLYQKEQPVDVTGQRILAGALTLAASAGYIKYEELIDALTREEYSGDKPFVDADNGMSRRSFLKCMIAGVVAANIVHGDRAFGAQNEKDSQEIDRFAERIVRYAQGDPKEIFKLVWGTDVPGLYAKLDAIRQGAHVAISTNYQGGVNSNYIEYVKDYPETPEQAAQLTEQFRAVEESAKEAVSFMEKTFALDPATGEYVIPEAYATALAVTWATDQITSFVNEKNRAAEVGRHFKNFLASSTIMAISIPLIELFIKATDRFVPKK